MTWSNPEQGERFGRTGVDGPLIYVGTLSSGKRLLERADSVLVEMTEAEGQNELFPYLEPVVPLERGQCFQRTRNDYAGSVAEVLAVFRGQETYAGDFRFNPVWVAYHLHGGAGDREPRLKDETSFRRIFGRRVDFVDRPVT